MIGKHLPFPQWLCTTRLEEIHHMLSLMRWSWLPAVVLSLLLVGGPSSAAEPGIIDNAHFFKPETVKRADTIIRDIRDRYRQEVLIETFDNPPGGQANASELSKMSPQEREKFY